jgi:hypothetical protein
MTAWIPTRRSSSRNELITCPNHPECAERPPLSSQLVSQYGAAHSSPYSSTNPSHANGHPESPGARRNNSRTAFHSFADKVNVRPLSVARGTSSERRVVADAFIPIYPNALPAVPKPSRSSRTASLVVNNLEAIQSAITRLLNRFAVPKTPTRVRIPPSPP